MESGTGADRENRPEAGQIAGLGIRCEGLGKTFSLADRDVRALRGLELSVPPGGFLAVAGRSGCGKTTLLRLLAGLEEPTSGRIRFFAPSGEIPRAEAKVGFVFQEPRLMPWLTVESNLAFGLGDLPREEALGRVDRVLDLVGLGEFRRAYPRQISGGMAQRVALGRTLAYEPDLVLLDEPFGSLDYFTRRGLWREVGELHRRTGRTFLLVTHDVEEALALGDSVLVLRDGGAAALLEVPGPRPRDPSDPSFVPLRRRIFAAIGEIP